MMCTKKPRQNLLPGSTATGFTPVSCISSLLSSRLYCRYRNHTGSAAKAVHGLYRRSGICALRSTLPRRIPVHFYVTIVCVWSGDVNCFLRCFQAFWDFFAFSPVKGVLMYFYMILHKLSLICHQIVTKSHRVAPNTNQHPRDPASAFHSGPSGHPDDYIHYK